LAEPVLTQRRHCHLVNSRAMVGIKLLFRQPIRQVHVFHWSSRSSRLFCISAPHSSRRNCSSSNPRHVLCLCDAQWRHFISLSDIKVKVSLGLAKVKP